MLWVWSLAFWQRFQKRGCCPSYGQNWTILHILSILCWTTTGACSAKTPSTAICRRKTFFSFQPKFSFGLIVCRTCHCDVTISTSMGRAREVSMIGVHTFSFTIKAALLVLSYRKHHSMINDCGYICLLSLDAHLYVSLGRHHTKVPLSSLRPFQIIHSTQLLLFSSTRFPTMLWQKLSAVSVSSLLFSFFVHFLFSGNHALTFSVLILCFLPIHFPFITFLFCISCLTNQYLLSHLWWISLLNKM